MKFPTHIILDVSRPTVVKPKAKLGWHKFYHTRFNKPNSLFNQKNLDFKSQIDRILVTKTQSTPATVTTLRNVKRKFSPKKEQVRKTKYFLPYKLSFSKANLAQVRKLIQSRRKASVSSESKFDNFTALGGSKTKYQFLSDRIVKDFKLERELFLHFNSSVLNPQTKNPEIKTFKQWKSQLTTPRTSVLRSKDLRAKLVTKARTASKQLTSSAINKKFCFSGYTVQLKINQAPNHSWNKRLYSKNLHHPTHSRLRALFNINFLVKELHYSKLKYSKTAERDIVSSGSAALFAGFIGFLISEKFGIELVDSGDFYFVVMYGVFVGFSFKAFVAGLESHVTDWDRDTDSRAYTHKPAKWLTLGVNFFTYLFTLLHLLLRWPHNVLHSVYPPFNFTLAEFITYMNFGFIGQVMLKYARIIFQFLSSFPPSKSDHYKR